MIARLRNKFIGGLLVILPVAATVWVLEILFSLLDDFSQPLLRIYFGSDIPGAGVVLTVIIVVLLGHFSSHFVGEAVVTRFEKAVSRVPLVRSVYGTVQQVVRGFSSGGESSNFKRTVIVLDESGLPRSLGFLTSEFVLEDLQGQSDGGGDSHEYATVYVPTNHLYLGDVMLLPRRRVLDANMSLEDGISAVLSCGGSMPDKLRPGTPRDTGS